MSDCNLDRLSDLPDSLLICILSRLKAKQVVQTCILSKRWSQLWIYVPFLDFDLSEFENEVNSNGKLERFENFVSMFLCIRDDVVNVDTFQLKFKFHDSFKSENTITDSARKRWIPYALNHNLKNLQIRICGTKLANNSHLPNSLYVCRSLEEVSIELACTFWNFNTLPQNIFLPKLKQLRIARAYIKDDIMNKLLSGCPTLESLNLEFCYLKMDNLSLRTVKQLSISSISWSVESSPVINIFGPCLKYLHIHHTSRWIVLKNMSKVTTVKITIGEYGEYKNDLLSSLSGVEDLHLEILNFRGMLKRELLKCPTFHNLKRLTLGSGCVYCDVHLWSSFVERCPNLKYLTLLHIETKTFCKVFKKKGHGREEARKLMDDKRFRRYRLIMELLNVE